ncbi:hypothetical protein DPEC_G00217750 [Dallia pectoralis]|uniref:Uncharacterized protein n=1 Tax=Dallia pectoralis TaxID=75939 RepID=A0ACC2G304_DALPE|nr:hypothetical protein DPEC_G00217750 [Dallia pectoralis]
MAKIQFGFNLNLGNTAQAFLFEGQPDHLVHATSEFLIESHLFEVAGRILGHSFLHEEPCFAGLSPAILHVVFCGDPEMTTVVLEDCPHLDVRTTMQLELRRGLKETMLWPLLTSRPDVVPLLFPRTKEMQYTPQMILDRINWPLENDSDEDEDFSLEERCRTTGF